ncbi:hypothetical protein [Paraherbaspirillum soli]|uniref:Transmembrane protein n=1 Tax=Paraherbaspirillum soli TaxID=631222 RepID=A0ABW0MA79_9BURK
MLRLTISILWPSFLAAALAEGCFFSLFDPRDWLRIDGLHELPPMACYTIGFFFFWTCCAMASMLTYHLAKAPNERPPCRD